MTAFTSEATWFPHVPCSSFGGVVTIKGCRPGNDCFSLQLRTVLTSADEPPTLLSALCCTFHVFVWVFARDSRHHFHPFLPLSQTGSRPRADLPQTGCSPRTRTPLHSAATEDNGRHVNQQKSFIHSFITRNLTQLSPNTRKLSAVVVCRYLKHPEDNENKKWRAHPFLSRSHQ